MLKESEDARYAQRRTHRTYTAEFKSQLVAACQQPQASIAGLAVQHGMNANVLHRWIKEHQYDGRHQIAHAGDPAVATRQAPPGFVAVQLSEQSQVGAADIRVEIRKGATALTINWPIAAAAQCAAWIRELLR